MAREPSSARRSAGGGPIGLARRAVERRSGSGGAASGARGEASHLAARAPHPPRTRRQRQARPRRWGRCHHCRLKRAGGVGGGRAVVLISERVETAAVLQDGEGRRRRRRRRRRAVPTAAPGAAGRPSTPRGARGLAARQARAAADRAAAAVAEGWRVALRARSDLVGDLLGARGHALVGGGDALEPLEGVEKDEVVHLRVLAEDSMEVVGCHEEEHLCAKRGRRRTLGGSQSPGHRRSDQARSGGAPRSGAEIAPSIGWGSTTPHRPSRRRRGRSQCVAAS